MTQPISLPMPTNNNADAAKKSGTTIQPGVYKMRATDAALGYTNGTPPAPQVGVLMEFVDGPYKGLSLTWYGFFTDKTEVSTFRALRTLGKEDDDLSDLSMVTGEAPCTVVIEPDLNGVAQAKIRFIGGGAIAMKSVMSEEQKKAFAAAMKAKFSQVKATDDKKESTPPTSGTETKKFF